MPVEKDYLPIEDCDYFIHYVPFPNRGARAILMLNDDDTYTMYIDSNLDRESQIDAYIHEIEHIVYNDMYTDVPRCY